MTATYSMNTALNGIEVAFPNRPGTKVLESLKENGFRR